MRIASISTHLLCSPYTYGLDVSVSASPTHVMPPTMNCLLVRVTTDTGLVGWGECFGFALVSTTRHVLDSLIAPAAVGLPALDIDDTMRTLHKRFHNFGRNGPVTFALSGIDIALWDIRGKHLGRSIYDLLGGAKRDSVSCYASLLPYGNAQLVADNAKRAVEMHYSALKLHEVNVECIEAVHRACPDTPLMLDVNCSFFTQTTAAEFCQTVSDQSRFSDRVLFVEEPLWPPEDFAALSALRSAQPLSVAAGENAGSLAELQSMLHHGAVDIIQPSVIKCGGLSALIQLAAHVKSAHPVRLVPHSPYFGPGLLATLHFLAAADTDEPLELYFCDLAAPPYPQICVNSEGRVQIPSSDCPGLGFELSEHMLSLTT